MPTPAVYTRREAADIIGVTPHTVDALLDDGTLRRIRIGKRLVRIPVADVLVLVGQEVPNGAA
jgi:excisionase family DNA binding protein